jgi:tripartite-type tricarboxylate transporter receptor subunit TctC
VAVEVILARLHEYAVPERLAVLNGVVRFDLQRRDRLLERHGLEFRGGEIVPRPHLDADAPVDVVMTTDGIPGLIGQIKAGKLKALAVTSTQRLPGLDIPTVAETYPGFEAIGWFQIILPAGTPAAVIDKVNADVNRIIMSADMSARLNDMGVYPRADSPAAAREFFASQQRAMKKLVADLGIQPQ